MTSTVASRFALACLLSAIFACGHDTASDGSSGGSSSGDPPATDEASSAAAIDDSSSAAASEASSDGGGSTSDASDASDTGGVMASWMLDSNIVINDQALAEAVVSVVAMQDSIGVAGYTEIVFTNVPAYCDALTSGSCGVQGETFTFELQLVGTEPGTYDIADGTASALLGDLTESCLSGGFGASSGTITISTLDPGPGGHVDATFDVQFDFLGSYATGTVVAPICDYDPTP